MHTRQNARNVAFEAGRDKVQRRAAGYDSPAIRHDLNLQFFEPPSLRASGDTHDHVRRLQLACRSTHTSRPRYIHVCNRALAYNPLPKPSLWVRIVGISEIRCLSRNTKRFGNSLETLMRALHSETCTLCSSKSIAHREVLKPADE